MQKYLSNFLLFEPAPYTNNSKIMGNVKYLLEYNKCDRKLAKKYICFDTKYKIWNFKVENSQFNGNTIKKLLCAINYVLSIRPMPIIITLKNSSFQDKLVIKVLECICFYLIKHLKIDIHVNMKIKRNPMTDGIKHSSLNAKSPEEMEYFFYDDTTPDYFRRIVSYENSKTTDISSKSSEVLAFFKNLRIDSKTSIYLAEAISEVLGNAIEHGKSECLIDIDVTENIIEQINYFVINVVVLNFSDTPIYKKLKKKLNEPLKGNDETKERYERVLLAKEFHQKHFNSKYTEDDFYIISSFQHGISGDFHKEGIGGVGLTQLIRAIEEKADGDYCYMLSEKRAIHFVKDYMHYDDDMFIGFNAESNFFTELPDEKVLLQSDTVFPGVAYNLSFVIKKEDFNNAK